MVISHDGRVGLWVTFPEDAESVEMRELYALAGLALYSAQCLEHEIVNSLGLLAILPYWTTKRPKSRAEYKAHVDQIWSENYERTFGQLLEGLQQSGITIPSALASLLRDSLEKRNRLVHRYFRERAKDWFNPKGRSSMAVELKAMEELFRETDRALRGVTATGWSMTGLTQAKIAAVTELVLADASDEEIDKVLAGK